MVLDTLFGVGRRRCALAVHIGRLYRSRHRARRSFKSRRARCAHGTRCPLWRRTPPSLSSCRLHRTFIPLSPSCKAIVQVETRSCAHVVLDAFLWCQAAAAAVLSLSTLDIIPLSPSCKAGSFKSRRACHALMVLDALLWRQTPPSLSSRRPHRTFIPISPSCRAIV